MSLQLRADDSDGGTQPCPPSDCFILRLADEVLVDIVSAAAEWPEPEKRDDLGFLDLYATRWALTLVSRRLHRLAMPILYSQIILGNILNPRLQSNILTPDGSRISPCPKRVLGAVVLLRRSIDENPSLRPLCKEMVLDIDACFRRQDQVRDLIAGFSSTRSLRIHDGFDQAQSMTTWACLPTALANMRHLERLEFTCGNSHIRVGLLLPALRAITVDRYLGLKELRLHGFAESMLPVRIPLRDAQRRAPFTELTISDYREGPETFRVLLNMPARLERFTFGGLSLSGYHPLNLRAVWLCLLPHVLTLESVRIGSMSNLTPLTPLRGMLAGVDFASFGRLTDLSLSFWATGSDDAGGEEAAGGGLLAPRLAAFEWVFDGDDGRALYADHFGPQEADFLRRLARAAVARRVPLRRIAVVFTPAPVVPIRYNLVSGVGLEGPEACDSDAAEHLEYPWDRMDRLADELRPMGIELTYNTPSVTRERFEAAVEEYRNAVAAARAGGQQARAAGVPSTISAGGGLLVDYWDLGGRQIQPT